MNLSAIDDLDRLRYDAEDDRNRSGLAPDDSPGEGASSLAVTVHPSGASTAYPTAAGKFVAFQFKGVIGAEVEGGAGNSSVIEAATAYHYAYIPAGASVPPAGTEIVVIRVRYRWVADV